MAACLIQTRGGGGIGLPGSLPHLGCNAQRFSQSLREESSLTRTTARSTSMFEMRSAPRSSCRESIVTMALPIVTMSPGFPAIPRARNFMSVKMMRPSPWYAASAMTTSPPSLPSSSGTSSHRMNHDRVTIQNSTLAARHSAAKLANAARNRKRKRRRHSLA